MKKNLPTASVEQILLWYDRPEIVLLKINSIEQLYKRPQSGKPACPI